MAALQTNLPHLIRRLLDPAAYAEGPGKVELRQTHISYILLTDLFAYKIKKPVDFGFLDFTSLPRRRFYCGEEVRLNRRLAPDIYIGVVPVTIEGGRAEMDGRGEPVEYAVKMRRIPDNVILDNALKAGRAGAHEIEEAGRLIARFHLSASTSEEIAAYGRPEAIRRNTGENFLQTFESVGLTIPGEAYSRIKAYTDTFLSENAALFEERVREGFIRDCHGDIHCEHVVLGERMEIFDCIEFNERFRYSDVVSDSAFLSMDLDSMNRADLSRVFEDSYFTASGDDSGRALMPFYKCYRAYVRGKVEGFKLAEPEIGGPEKALSTISALQHFSLSLQYSEGGARPVMAVISGLSGSGKTTLSRALSEATGLVHLSSDSIRKGLSGMPEGERRGFAYGEGIYTEEMTERTYSELISRAEALLKEGRSVIIDATFLKKRHLDLAREAAQSLGAIFKVITCEADDGTVRKRFLKRAKEGPREGIAASDADWEVYLRQKEVVEVRETGRKIDAGKAPELSLVEAAREVFG